VQLVGQSGGEWDTWSGTAGGGEDPFVSDAYLEKYGAAV